MIENNKKVPSMDNGIKKERATDIITKFVEVYNLQPYDVASYFVNFSRYVLDIAREFEISISETMLGTLWLHR